MAVPKPLSVPPKPPVNVDRLAADIFNTFVARFGVRNPTPQDAEKLAAEAYTYAEAFGRVVGRAQ